MQNQANSFFDLVKTRRSVRKFKPDPIPEVHITQILDAARLAPTAGNRQPWKFLVIQDSQIIEQLKQACIQLRIKEYIDEKELTPAEMKEVQGEVKAYYDDLFLAQLYVAILTDSNAPYSHYNLHDGALAAGYLCLAARALGYGTVYMTESIYESATREICHIPDDYERVCVIPIGVPDDLKERRPKKSLEEVLVHNMFE
ncbi:MAG: nitroreductase family protein [Chloroflexi bacterium]|nr:nitroreductase family protein [Chloroflexota bacterium]